MRIFIEGAIRIANTIHRAAADAVRGMPGAAAVAFASHIDAALDGSYPTCPLTVSL